MTMLGAVSGLVLATCAPNATLTGSTGFSDPLEEEGPPQRSAESNEAARTSRGGNEPPPTPEGTPQGPEQQTESVEEPDVEFTDVTTQIPQLRIQGVPDDRNLVGELSQVEGVHHASSLRLGEVAIAVDDKVHGITVAAVNPERFRQLTPQVTADAVDVWERIVDGDAAFVHDVANRLKLELGERLPAAGHTTLRVGAFASNGAPPVADAVVNRDMGAHLGVGGPKTVLVVAAEGTSPSDLAERIRQATGFEAELLEEPTPQRAMLSGSAARNAFEPFGYISLGDGMIQIERGWVSRNIVSADVPVFPGTVRCHRLLIPQLRGALQEIQAEGLDQHIRPNEYGGCFSPRHVMFNPNRGLSMHAWGLAIDFNVSTNSYGAHPDMHPRIVEIFQKWGFVWGGHWSTPDGMHFELGALMDGP